MASPESQPAPVSSADAVDEYEVFSDSAETMLRRLNGLSAPSVVFAIVAVGSALVACAVVGVDPFLSIAAILVALALGLAVGAWIRRDGARASELLVWLERSLATDPLEPRGATGGVGSARNAFVAAYARYARDGVLETSDWRAAVARLATVGERDYHVARIAFLEGVARMKAGDESWSRVLVDGRLQMGAFSLAADGRLRLTLLRYISAILPAVVGIGWALAYTVLLST